MPPVTSPREDEVRHAYEVLSAASPELLAHGLQGSPTLSSSFINEMSAFLVNKFNLAAVGDALAGLPTGIDPSLTRTAQAAENVWRRVENEFGLLSSSEVAELLGASNNNRAYASSLRKRGELLGMMRKHAYVFPGFQFDQTTGEIHRWVKPLLVLASENDYSTADVIMWMMSPTTYFNGDRPADHLGDAELLPSVAERAWGVEW